MRSGIAAATAVLALSSCGSESRSVAPVTVFAASSLTEAFTELGASDPDVHATFNFASSSTLAQQILQGAEADAFAPADDANMQKVAASADAPIVFARNKLAIVVEKGNPKGLRGLADLAGTGLIVVLCGADVPCGRFADQTLSKAGVTLQPASREENVKAVLTKVRLGEADAGIVYVSDVRSAADAVDAVEIPDAQNVVASYPIAVLKSARNPAGARAFVRLVTSAIGSRTLQRHGFLPAA